MTIIATKPTPNTNQQICIDNTEGKYLVLAGPGTGKTFTIVERIKNMLNKGIQAEKILCLTFTDAAATEMKRRIEKELNVVSTNVEIYTYHGFCCNIIENYQEEFEIPSNYKVISDPVSKAFIKECIDEINPEHFRTEKNDPYFYINTIKNRISLIKQNRLTKEEYFNNIKENPDWEPEKIRLEEKIQDKIKKGNTKMATDLGDLKSVTKKINQAIELWQFYELYQEKMIAQRYLDFNDMINLVLIKFEQDPSFLTKIANEYEYVMVDEYQDTNKSQNEIVFCLAKALESQNIFVVGDDDQIIYRFQGAKLDTIENYLNTFKDTKIVCLKENMRSTQNILNAAREVISQDPLSLVNNCNFVDINNEPISKNLTAMNKEVTAKEKAVRFYKYADDLQEKTEIVKEIENLINSDDCPNKDGQKLLSQIAVLTRSNAEAQEYAELLKSRNIPYELKDGKDIFTIPAVNILYFYMQFLINPNMYSYRIFQILMSPPFNINPKDYKLLVDESSKEKNFIDSIKDIAKDKFIDYEKIDKFIKTYEYLSQYKTTENIKNTVLEIGAKTGIFDYYLNNEINRTESIAGLKKFLDEAIGFSEIYKTSFIEEFNTYLKSIIEDEEKITTQKAPVTLNAVQLCTYHSSKGREFEYVYMPALISEKWESNKKSLRAEIPVDKSEYESPDDIKNLVKPSDLTKLMYVAMTRAKHALRLSYPESINKKAKKATRFLVDINYEFEKEEEPFKYDENNYWEQVSNLLIKKPYDYKKDFNDLIQAKLNDRSYSPSSINRYLSCPRKFLYNDILELGAQDGNPNYTSYGSAIHKALEDTVNYIKEHNEYPEVTLIISWFKKELSKQPMENYEQRQNFIGRGEKALQNYYCQITNMIPQDLYAVEEKIDYVLEDGTKFYGIIDRIDANKDGTYTIYDYKTGNNKNSYIGIDKTHEDYYNQMAWYKYFWELKTGNKVSLTKFIYPEDFETKNEGITYSDDEITERVEKFKEAINSIKNCEFEPSYNENACKFCPYKDFCGMNLV